MTLPDLLSIVVTVAVGAGATLITMMVTMGKVQTQMSMSNQRIEESEKRNIEAMNAFRQEATELRKAVTELTRIVAQQSVFFDGAEQLYERLRRLEVDVAVMKERQNP